MGKDEFLPKFQPDNWHDWSFKMIGHLQAKGVFGAIDHQSNDWESINDQKQQDMRLKAFNELLKSLGNLYSSIARIFRHHQAQELWQHLRDEFRHDTLPNQLDLNEEFVNFQHKEGEDVESFLVRFDDVVNRLGAAGLAPAPNICFLRLIKAFPPSLNDIRQNLIVSEEYNIAKARRLARRYPSSFTQTSNSVLRIGGKERAKLDKLHCHYCRQSGHPRTKCESRLADEKLGLFLPNCDAPWRTRMEETINKRIDEAFKKGLAEGKQEEESKDEQVHAIQEAYDDIDGFSFD